MLNAQFVCISQHGNLARPLGPILLRWCDGLPSRDECYAVADYGCITFLQGRNIVVADRTYTVTCVGRKENTATMSARLHAVTSLPVSPGCCYRGWQYRASWSAVSSTSSHPGSISDPGNFIVKGLTMQNLGLPLLLACAGCFGLLRSGAAAAAQTVTGSP